MSKTHNTILEVSFAIIAIVKFNTRDRAMQMNYTTGLPGFTLVYYES